MRLAVVCLTSIAVAVPLTAPAHAAPLSRSWRQEDVRLGKKVTLRLTRTHVGEILERLSAETDVSLSAGDGDGAADEQLSVCLNDVPLADAMDALWSVVSYRPATWHWSRTGSAGSYRYRLLRPREAQLFPLVLQQRADDAFEHHAATMIAVADLPPEELRALTATDKAAGRLLESGRIRMGMSTFASALSPQDRAAVLKQGRRIKMQVSDLPVAGQAFVRSVFDQMVPAETRLPETRPPDTIEFYVRHGADAIFPTLFLQLDWLGGYNYLGGRPLDAAFAEEMADLWLLPGDRATTAESERRAGADTNKEADDLPVLERRIRELSTAASLSVVARLPARQIQDPGSPLGQSVASYLLRLKKTPPYLQHKWRNGVLLLTYPAWFLQGSVSAPYEAVRWLRQQAATQSGFLSLDDLSTAADRLSEAELLALKAEFPVMAHVAYWRHLLRLRAPSKDTARVLGSRHGLPIGSVAGALRGLSDTRLESILGDRRVRAVRVMAPGVDGASPAQRRVVIELLDQRGKPLTAVSFSYARWQAKPES